jgi:hypothetical protein
MARDPAYQQLRAKLEAERDELIRAIDRLAGDPESAGIAVSLRENLGDVIDALTRLKRGTYGVCEKCSAIITRARVHEQPATRLCADCARDV